MSIWEEMDAGRPPRTTRETPVEVSVVGRRCVYVNSYRVAGGKPYYSENLPSHEFQTTLGNVLDAFTDKQIRAALREAKADRDYLAAFHAARRQEQSA